MKNIFKIIIVGFLLIIGGLVVIASDIIVKQGDLTINKLTTTGNVGIGANTPRSKLTVATGTSGDSGKIEFRLGSNDGSARDLIIRKDTTTPYGTSFISAANPTVDSGTFRFYTSDRAAGERMVITSSGNVGIGTTTPSAKLHVSGAIKSSNLVNTATGAGATKVLCAKADGTIGKCSTAIDAITGTCTCS